MTGFAISSLFTFGVDIEEFVFKILFPNNERSIRRNIWNCILP